MAPVVEARGLHTAFNGRVVLQDCSLTVAAGERVAITGGIGSGKSTLLRSFVGLHSPAQGSLRVFGNDPGSETGLQQIRKRTGYLFQDSEDQLFCATVEEDVAFGPLNQGVQGDDLKRAVAGSLEMVGLAGFEHRVIHHLSGGEQRLVALATIIAMRPELLILDEPYASLDEASRQRVAGILKQWQGTVIFAAHSTGTATEGATRCLHLSSGRIGPIV